MSEVVKLTKGQKIKLTKPGSSLNKIMCGYKWEEKPGPSWDLDGSIICLDKSGKVVTTVYYGNLNFGKYIQHHGDNLTGAGKWNSDKEQIDVSLRTMPNDVERLIVIMNIYHAYMKKQDLTGISNCSMHIQDTTTGKDLAEFDISGKDTSKYKKMTGFYIGTFYRDGTDWKFEAIGEAIRTESIAEMQDIASTYYRNGVCGTFAEYIQDHPNNRGLGTSPLERQRHYAESQTSYGQQPPRRGFLDSLKSFLFGD